MLSSSIGSVFFYLLYETAFLHAPIDHHRATFAWSLSYFISIFWQNALHRWLVFGAVGSFSKSLLVNYAVYTVSLFLSTTLVDILTVQYEAGHRLAYATALGTTGILNFVVLSQLFARIARREEALSYPLPPKSFS